MIAERKDAPLPSGSLEDAVCEQSPTLSCLEHDVRNAFPPW